MLKNKIQKKKEKLLRLKIFLEEKTIFLTENKGLVSLNAGWIIEYDPESSMKDLLKEFTEAPRATIMAIWTRKESFFKLKKDFFSLFRSIEAGGGIVRNEKDELLFIFRRGKWDLPKGKMKNRNLRSNKETAKTAALREVKEETGLKNLSVVGETDSTFHIYYIKKKPVLKHTRWFEMRSSSREIFIPEARESITEVKWIGRRGLDMVLGNTYASLRDLIEMHI